MNANTFGQLIGGDIADVLLFLHLIFFTAALIIPSQVSRLDLYQHLLDLVFLFSFWIFLYAFFVAPFGFIFPDRAVYDDRFATLCLFLSICLTLIAGIHAVKSSGLLRQVYSAISVASLANLISLFEPASAFLNPGKNEQFNVLEQVSAICFVWITLTFSQAVTKEVLDQGSTAGVSLNPLLGVPITVILILAGLVETFRSNSQVLLSYRLAVTISATFVFIPLLIREVLRQKDLSNREHLHQLRQAISDAELTLSRNEYTELVETVPAIVWRIDPHTLELKYVNPQLTSILGYRPEEWMRSSHAWIESVPRADRKTVQRALEQGRGKGHIEIDHRITAASGVIRWLKTSLRETDIGGRLSLIGVSVDVTEQKTAEQLLRLSEGALRSSERRQRMFLDQTIFGIVEWDADFRVRTWNRAATSIFGFTAHEVVGKHAFDFLVPPEAQPKLLDLFQSLHNSAGNQSVNENIHKDNKRIICEWFNSAIVDEGELVGIISVVHDVTRETLAERSLRDFGLRVLAAQEEERRRIARELHDDIGQDLALLSMAISMQGENKKDLLSKTEYIIRKLSRLSHQLHSAQLELLGLDSAIRSACSEMERTGSITIAFASGGVPTHLDKDVALCFYRVAQEALHNVQKHSAASSARIEVAIVDGQLNLTVSDNGRGFDTENGLSHFGLGLISMRERMHAIGGELTIKSAPGCGTQVKAMAPIKMAASARMA